MRYINRCFTYLLTYLLQNVIALVFVGYVHLDRPSISEFSKPYLYLAKPNSQCVLISARSFHSSLDHCFLLLYGYSIPLWSLVLVLTGEWVDSVTHSGSRWTRWCRASFDRRRCSCRWRERGKKLPLLNSTDYCAVNCCRLTVCLSVCLYVCKISRKRLIGFWWYFQWRFN